MFPLGVSGNSYFPATSSGNAFIFPLTSSGNVIFPLPQVEKRKNKKGPKRTASACNSPEENEPKKRRPDDSSNGLGMHRFASTTTQNGHGNSFVFNGNVQPVDRESAMLIFPSN